MLWLTVPEGPDQDWEDSLLWVSGGCARRKWQRAHGRENYLHGCVGVGGESRGGVNRKRLSHNSPQGQTSKNLDSSHQAPLSNGSTASQLCHPGGGMCHHHMALWVSLIQTVAVVHFPRIGKAIKKLLSWHPEGPSPLYCPERPSCLSLPPCGDTE